LKKAENVVGKIFNKLKVVEQISVKGDKTYCICECLCGNDKIIKVAYTDLKRGRTKSCGCIAKGINKKHGMTHTRIYNIWNKMIGKCYNIKNRSYKFYGERGIIVSNEWLDEETGFINFYNWAMDNGYTEELFINRKNADDCFSPINCTWSKYIDNSNFDKNKMIFITYNNETHTISEWSKITGFKIATIITRLKRDIDINDLFLTRNELLEKTIKNKHESKIHDFYKPFDEDNNMIAEKYKSGIYKITNIINNKIYIGSAVNVYIRWKAHIQLLQNNNHHSIYLQNSWNKYGGGNFKFEVIEYVEDNNLLIEKEQYYFDIYKPYNPLYGYNESPTASSPLGVKHTDETKIIMGNSHKKPIIQLEYNNNIFNYINRYDGVIDAEKELNIKSQNIIQCCKLTNKYYRAGGFIWMYEEDYNNKERFNYIFKRFINWYYTSSFSKNKKAKELNVPIISEQSFNEMIGR